MNPLTVAKIFKGIGKAGKAVGKVGKVGKTAGKVGKAATKGSSKLARGGLNLASDAVESGSKKALNMAHKFNTNFMRDIRPDELEFSLSPAQHLIGRKAKMSTNLMAFGALAAYGAASGMEKEGALFGGAKRGDIEAGYQYGMINESINPVLKEENKQAQNNPEAFQEQVTNSTEQFGSAGADIVFALHQLRNR